MIEKSDRLTSMKVGNMRRLIIITGILMMILGSVSGCTPQLSDQQIKADILNIIEFRSATLISDQTTITKEKDDDVYHVFVSAAIDKSKDTHPCTIMIDVTSTYIKTEGKWTLDEQTYVIDQVIPAKAPSMRDVVDDLERQLRLDPPDFSFFSEYFQDPDNFVLVSSTPGSNPSKLVLVIETVMGDGSYSNSMRFTVDCVFARETGWAYSLADWIKHESMNWTGTYDLVFTIDEPGFPSNYLNQFYDVGDEIKGMIIQGTSSLLKKMSEPRIVNSDIKVSFSFKGENYLVDAVNDGSPNRLWIKIIGDPDRTHYEDSDIILYYIMKDHSGQGNDGKYHLEALCMYGEITKQP